jgi:hypothetical protein
LFNPPLDASGILYTIATAPREEHQLHGMTRASGDAAAEPLIANDPGFPSDVDHEGNELDVNENGLVSPGIFIWTLTVCAGLSGLLFGYE